MQRIFYIFFFSGLLVLKGTAQDHYVDSLLKVYEKETGEIKRMQLSGRILLELQQDHDTTLYYFKKFNADARNAGYKLGEAYTYHALGLACVENAHYEEARTNLFTAISKYKALMNDSMVAKADIRVAFSYYSQADFEKAIKTYLEAIEYARKAKDLKTEAHASNLLGLVFTKKPNPDYKTALTYYSRSLDINRQINSIQGFGMVMLRMGTAYSMLDDYKNAEAYLNRALALGDSLDDRTVLKWTYAAFSKYYKKRKEFRRSLEIEKRFRSMALRSGDYPGIIISYRNGADCNFALNNNKDALVYIDSALHYALGHGVLENLSEIYEVKAEVHNALKQTDEAFFYYKKSVQVRDSLFSAENSKNINELETKFQTSEKEKAIELLNVEKENDSKVKKILLSAVIIALVLIAFIVFVLIKINKARKEISFQKKIVEEKQKEVMDSINYATRIQKALMPTEKYIEKVLSKNKKS